MDAKLDKLTKRAHATEEGISNTEEREAEKKIYERRKSVDFLC